MGIGASHRSPDVSSLSLRALPSGMSATRLRLRMICSVLAMWL